MEARAQPARLRVSTYAPRTEMWPYVTVLSLVAVASAIFSGIGGWEYYTTPLAVRGYHPLHPLLKPSGLVAHTLGIAGLVMMTVPVVYSVRKRWRRLSRLGSLRIWLHVHLYCGIVGPALVTVHSSGKFNGLISVAFWAMTAVVVSGFAGRYLYVRIPHNVRGAELSRKEIEERIAALKKELSRTGLPQAVLARMDSVEDRAADAGAAGRGGGARTHRVLARQVTSVRRELKAASVDREVVG
ncbi:MAG: hypothetical protein EHM13_09830, partial [Acidobacteria bacterium]